MLVKVGLGALFHPFVPRGARESPMGAASPFAVPRTAFLGVRLYGNGATPVPAAASLIEKAVPLGNALAFLRAMAAPSFPEAVLLRGTMRFLLVALLSRIIALAIVATDCRPKAVFLWP